MGSRINAVQGNSTAQQTAQNYGFVYPAPTFGNNFNSASERAETINDVATALLNQDIEQQQFLRNHDYAAEYQRYVSAGMNPLTAMQALSGGAASYTPVSAHNTSSTQEAAPLPDMLGAIANSAKGAFGAYDLLASANLKNTQAELMPDQYKTLQDLQRSESALNTFDLLFRSTTFDSDVSAKTWENRLREWDVKLKELESHQRYLASQYAKKQLEWFDPMKQQEMSNMIQDLKESVARETSHYASAKASVASAAQSYSQAALNDTQRTEMIPAQVDFMGKQGTLVDKQGNFVDEQTFNQQVANCEKRLENIHRQTGLPYNVAAGVLIQDLEAKDVFDEFGNIKSGKNYIDESTAAGRILRNMDRTDQLQYHDAHNTAKAAIIQGYINSGAQVVNSGANVFNAVKGSPFMPTTVNSTWQNATPTTAPTPVTGFGN